MPQVEPEMIGDADELQFEFDDDVCRHFLGPPLAYHVPEDLCSHVPMNPPSPQEARDDDEQDLE
jgi:hypothetical protein